MTKQIAGWKKIRLSFVCMFVLVCNAEWTDNDCNERRQSEERNIWTSALPCVLYMTMKSLRPLARVLKDKNAKGQKVNHYERWLLWMANKCVEVLENSASSRCFGPVFSSTSPRPAHTDTEREREREREGHTHREQEKGTDRQTDTDTEINTHSKGEGMRDRYTHTTLLFCMLYEYLWPWVSAPHPQPQWPSAPPRRKNRASQGGRSPGKRSSLACPTTAEEEHNCHSEQKTKECHQMLYFKIHWFTSCECGSCMTRYG